METSKDLEALMPPVDVPVGETEGYKVERRTVTAEEARTSKTYAMIRGRRRWTPAGTYTGLMRKPIMRSLMGRGDIVMTDAPDEKRDHMEPVKLARGRCLVHGLGIGLVINAMLRKREVEHVTVIEKAEQVIELVGPHYEEKFGDRVTIIHDDALTWKPPIGSKWDVVWHDIWDEICSDNLVDMKKLHRRFARRAVWQGSWARDLCEIQAKEDRRWERHLSYGT